MTKPPRKRAPRLSRPVAPVAPLEADALFQRIVAILEDARARVVRTVNSEMVVAYWHIGREIVESLQGGQHRAEYGEAVLETLSTALGLRFGRGFSTANLRYFRLFYQAYADRRARIHHEARDGSRALPTPIHHEPRDVSRALPAPIHHEPRDVSRALPAPIHHEPRDVSADLTRAVDRTSPPGFSSRLSWTHYRVLTKVENAVERRFYEIEADRDGWSTTVLERQIHTQLFARLRKSRDKAGVLDLITRGLAVQRPIDVIRDPYVLDFLDLPDAERLHEGDLEAAIIEKLQHFLLELGKGFAFIGRQKRLEYEDECFYVDLVFYNCVLKCYLLIDLKMGKLTHQDVGQMDSYVRLFDGRYTTEGDNPTIGLILCAEKNQAVARYSVLHESEQIFAARYVTYLPTIEELERELLRERELIEAQRAVKGA